jgi:hypothetical protein
VRQCGARPGADELRTHRLAIGMYDDDGAGKLVRADITDPLPRTLCWSATWEMTRDATSADERQAERARALIPTPEAKVDVAGERTDVPELVGVPRGKLVLVTEDDLTYGAVRLDPDSLTTAVASYADPAWAAATGWPLLAALRDMLDGAEAGSDGQLVAVNALSGCALDRLAGWLARQAGRGYRPALAAV